MEFFNLNSYKKLAQLIVEQREHKTNSIILSLPGAGLSYYLKKFIERNKDVLLALKNLLLLLTFLI
jgi:hypothetical protein